MSEHDNLEALQRAFVGESVDRLLALRWTAFEDRQLYHGPEHSIVDLPTDGRRCLKAMIPEHYSAWFPLVRIGIAGHDWLQKYTTGIAPDGSAKIRIRDRGNNERGTARLVEERLRELNSQFASPLRSEHIRWIREGIEFTCPAFDAELGTVYQPLLQAALRDMSAHPVSIVIAMSDLAAAGGDWHVFLRGVFALIREEEIEIAKAVRESPNRAAIDLEDQERYRHELVRFIAGQARFVAGRKHMFRHEVGLLARPDYLGPEAGGRMLDRFAQFDRNVLLAERLAVRCQSMSFWDLIELVGFSGYPVD